MLAVTEYVTFPLPVPDDEPDATVIQEVALLAAVQPQVELDGVTVTLLPLLLPDPGLRLVGEISYVQAACVIVKVFPAIVIVPVRVEAPVLPETV